MRFTIRLLAVLLALATPVSASAVTGGATGGVGIAPGETADGALSAPQVSPPAVPTEARAAQAEAGPPEDEGVAAPPLEEQDVEVPLAPREADPGRPPSATATAGALARTGYEAGWMGLIGAGMLLLGVVLSESIRPQRS